MLFHVLTQRHERVSVIITSSLGFADWTQIFSEATLTAALLDRLTHEASIIQCNWESFRFRESRGLGKWSTVTGLPPRGQLLGTGFIVCESGEKINFYTC